jgi:hypothetical protein
MKKLIALFEDHEEEVWFNEPYGYEEFQLAEDMYLTKAFIRGLIALSNKLSMEEV